MNLWLEQEAMTRVAQLHEEAAKERRLREARASQPNGERTSIVDASAALSALLSAIASSWQALIASMRPQPAPTPCCA